MNDKCTVELELTHKGTSEQGPVVKNVPNFRVPLKVTVHRFDCMWFEI